jgi:hypothetical protein
VHILAIDDEGLVGRRGQGGDGEEEDYGERNGEMFEGHGFLLGREGGDERNAALIGDSVTHRDQWSRLFTCS